MSCPSCSGHSTMVGPDIHQCVSCGQVYRHRYPAVRTPSPEEIKAMLERESRRGAEAAAVQLRVEPCDDPVERFVLAVTMCSVNKRARVNGGIADEADPEIVYPLQLATLLPGSFRSPFDASRRWTPSITPEPLVHHFEWGFESKRPKSLSSHQIARWFAANALAAGMETTDCSWHEAKRGIFGGTHPMGDQFGHQVRGGGKLVHAQGWPIQTDNRDVYDSVLYVARDGSYASGKWMQREGEQVEPASFFDLRAVFIMGLKLGFKPATLGLQPHQARWYSH